METVLELKDQRNKLLHDAQKALLKENVSAEDMATAKRMCQDADFLELRIETRQGQECRIPPREQPGAGNGPAREERSRLERFIRYGEIEHRDILTTTGGAGAGFIPQEFYPLLTAAEKAWGPIIGELTVKETDNGAPMKIAFANDTANLLNLDTEPSNENEVDPTLSSYLLAVDPLKTDIIKVSVAELTDSFFDIDAFVRDAFGKRYYRGLTSLVTKGSATGNIQSLVTTATTGFTTTASSTAIAWSDMVALYGALDPAYLANACWSMNATTRALLLAVTDTLGRPLYIPSPTADSFDTILGKRVVLNQFLDSAASTKIPIQLGDFKAGYLLRVVKPGLAIVRLNERYMDTLEVGFLGYGRVAGHSTDAGTHPILNLVMKT